MFSWSVLKRLFFEFWPAFVIAVVWACYRAWPFQSDWVGTFITNFGGAFFFVSWFTGQFFRVERQGTTERTLNTLGHQLASLGGTVGILTERVNANPQFKQLSGLTGTANVQLAQANSTFADVRSSIGSPNTLVWSPSNSDVPKLPVGPTGLNGH
jgi:hypothetical protein